MADGPRCKRRKQANPKRSSVTNFNNGPEASSDSDDEDKLHIVEEESQEEKSHQKNKPVLPHNGDCNGMKNDCGSEEGEEDGEEDMEEEVAEAEEEEGQKDAMVQEMLEQEDTAVIYPEAPEENHGGADENGTPDDAPQLHMCPYCSRGYKRNASLKEHIKYRHETSDDNYSCSHCSYTFTYRSQLERHMSHHRGKEQTRSQAKVKPQRHSQSSGGSAARKFKCNVCTKAFKYKHHLKEHLRIHSGEKPYECANCHKRFSHSGSYSSHITSKKCAAAHFPNGLHHPPLKPQQVASMSAALAAARKEAKMDSKPLQEQIPLTQIKTEPIEEDIKPTTVPPVNGVNRSASGTTLPQGVAMVVPTVGLMSPIGINISGLQNVFGKVLATGTQGKQGFVVQQPQQQIISLPAFVDHDGTTKIIINYSLSPAAATTASSQPASLMVKNSPHLASAVPIVPAAPIPSRTEQSCTGEIQDIPTDLSISRVVKEEPDFVPISDDLGIVISKTESVAEMPKGNECLLCEECPEHLEAVHLLQHRKAANGEAVDSVALDPSFATLLSEAGVTLHEPSPAEDVLSVLKAAFASCARPSDSELRKISDKVSVPAEVVRKWFAKMNRKAAKAERSEDEEEFTTEDETEDEDTTMGEEPKVETEHSECRENSESPMNLKLNNNSELPKRSKVQKKLRQLEKKTKWQEKTESLEKSRTEEKFESREESSMQDKSEMEEEPESQKSKLQKDSEMQEKSNSQANLELHNYSKPLENRESQSTSLSSRSSDKNFKVVVKSEPYDPDAPDSQAEPLDLSLPKSTSPKRAQSPGETAETPEERSTATVPANVVVQPNVLQNLTRLETTPLNLACINKDQLEPRALYVTTPQSGNSNFVTATQIPTLVAIAGQGTVGCLSAINPTTKQRTILIPQLTYTYTPSTASAASKGLVLNGIKKEKKDRLVSVQKSAPPAGSLGNEQKKIKMDQGIYACDICCKVFQKGSSLLRHKYEHTGRRPHECLVCKKAFKHKHHLIEHARLHTGIKPYQCDKCGKRFSHSGSYSQHMNHRYSYCKRNPFSSNASSASSASSPAAPETAITTTTFATTLEQSNDDGVEEETLSQPASEEEEEEYEEEQEEYEDEAEYEEEAMCVEDIRVVQIDDAEGRQDGEDSGEEMEVELAEGSEEDWEDEAGGTDFREGSRRMTVRAK